MKIIIVFIVIVIEIVLQYVGFELNVGDTKLLVRL